jgi:hypothetical protein
MSMFLTLAPVFGLIGLRFLAARIGFLEQAAARTPIAVVTVSLVSMFFEASGLTRPR